MKYFKKDNKVDSCWKKTFKTCLFLFHINKSFGINQLSERSKIFVDSLRKVYLHYSVNFRVCKHKTKIIE